MHEKIYKMMKSVSDAMNANESVFSTGYEGKSGDINITGLKF